MGIRPLREGIPISQEYGTNPGGYNPAGGHTGRDYAAFQGEKLVAIADGRVWFADHSYNLPGGPQGWAQRLFLERAGCHAWQGYLLSRPVPGLAFEDLVLAHAAAVGPHVP